MTGAVSGKVGLPARRRFSEDWDPAYGTPATFELEGGADAVRVEDRDGPVVVPEPSVGPMAFVDGSRRAELSLWDEDLMTGDRVPGLAGVYAVGAVVIAPGKAATFAGVRRSRLVIWGGGLTGDLVGRGGWEWRSDSLAAADAPDQLLAHLQNRMRQAEGDLALDAADHGWNVVLDGPLNRIRNLHGSVTGYIKTHLRQLLPDEDHAVVTRLTVGTRTPLFAHGDDRYTCYVRVGNPRPSGTPWTGIARLEFPSSAGLDAVVSRADHLTATLPRYAGVAHRDPRAPVNLTPVRTLERHLSDRMGNIELAKRAAREAIAAGGAP